MRIDYNILMILSAVAIFFLLMYVMRKRIVRFLLRMRAKIRIRSMRVAIAEADDIKRTSGKKTLVVFNNHSGMYEPVKKSTLKTAVKIHKVKRNRRQTDGRKPQTRVRGRFTNDRVKVIEKKSVYVTN